MYYLQDINLKYGDRQLFKNVGFMFQDKDRIGLVGRNGAGKSTLLKVIAQEITADSGSVQYPKNVRIGYLKQFLPENKSVSIIDEVCKAFDEYNKVNSELIALEATLTNDMPEQQLADVLDQIDKLNTKLNAYDMTSPEAEASKVLKGLGFRDDQLDQPLDTLSGGWIMRVELAKLLLSKPDILLLDEPTNHLDIEAILWFEQYVKSYPSCIIIISHDEAFMKNTTNRIIEIELGRVSDYKMKYDKYLIEKAQRREIQLAEFENQQKMIKDKEKLIEKFRAKATKAKMAQSMIKQLDKVERIEVHQEDTSSMRLNFPYAGREGRVVYRAEKLVKQYDDHVVLNGVDIQIERGTKVAFIGQNGQGKTTLSKIIADLTPATGGVSEIGHNVQLSLYLQDQSDNLDTSITVLETAVDAGPQYTEREVRSILGSFMFSGEDVDKKVSVLSGGEKARVALACMIMHPSNLLILDEPTNHLDVVSKHVLKEAVSRYEGTMIVVSHDRAFLQGLTEETYEFVDKQIVKHFGDIEYVLKRRQKEDLRDYAVKSSDKKQEVVEKKPELSFDERKKLNRELSYVERDIQKLEKKIADIETQMMDPEFFKSDKVVEASQRLGKYQDELAEKMEQWEVVAEKLG